MQYAEAFNSPETLNPLDPSLRLGLCWVVFFGWLSLCASGGLFCLLTWRLGRWATRGQLRDGTNQFLVLVYNLLLADIQQAVAFTIPTIYLTENKIEVPSATCFVNGWFVSVGDLASGMFIFGIALHTFLVIVKGRRISNRMFYSSILSGWIFVYLMAIITANIHDIYTRAGAWCWISEHHADQRLFLHYLWIFVCMFSTITLYALLFIRIWIRSKSDIRTNSMRRQEMARTRQATKCMVIYPAAYVVCTLPLAACRMAAMQGKTIPYSLYCFAGAAITSCGWLDVVLYTTTRRVLILAETPPAPGDVGLDTFGWGDSNSFWGTKTTIEGPLTRPTDFPHRDRALLGSPKNSGRRLNGRDSDEDYFAAPVEGAIMTKTTVEVSSGPLPGYGGSEICMVNVRDSHSLKNHDLV